MLKDMSERVLVPINLNAFSQHTALFIIPINLHILMQFFSNLYIKCPWSGKRLLMSDTHSMLKNRKVCYFSGSGMRVPPPKKVHVGVQREHLDIQSISEPTVCISSPTEGPLCQHENPCHVLYCMFPLVAFNHQHFNVNST